jgi:hypothetical protein
MTRHDTLQCVHEPFGDAYYFGPERLAERYENDPKARKESGYEDSTYRTIFDRIARENSEVRPLILFMFLQSSRFLFFSHFILQAHPINVLSPQSRQLGRYCVLCILSHPPASQISFRPTRTATIPHVPLSPTCAISRPYDSSVSNPPNLQMTSKRGHIRERDLLLARDTAEVLALQLSIALTSALRQSMP